MSNLKLSLLRQPILEREGKPVEINRRKALALLAYLAVTRKSHNREVLATLLWPETSSSQARLGLRQALWDLNRALGKDCLEIFGETIALNLDGQLWIDVHNFCGLIDECRTHGHPPNEACERCMPLLEGAANLYQDNFMAGFNLPDCTSFDEWQFFENEELQRELNGVLEKLVQYSIEKHDFEAAIPYARRWSSLDSQAEEPHRVLMRLYAWTGQRSAALRQYGICESILSDEWSIAPSEETTRLYKAIKEGRLPPPMLHRQDENGEGPTRLPLDEAQLPSCPYRGLFAFREEDASYFYGREECTSWLLEAVGQKPMVAIIGPSGSGKSSLVYAGLLAKLRQDSTWAIADLRPGSHPFQSLAIALLTLLVKVPGQFELERLMEIRKLADALSQGVFPLADTVAQILKKNPLRRRVLLLVDQFEELYSHCWNPEIRSQFMETLLAAAHHPSQNFTLLLTLRADFLEQALIHQAFADALQNGGYHLGPMTRPELVRAIRLPAEQEGILFEAGLVERILDEVGEEPGNLPLLEFALTSLWERQSAGKLTHAAHDAGGRVKGALTRYAEEVYLRLSPAEQEAAQRLFIQMVRPGVRAEDTRRQAARTDFREEEWKLAQRLADARLLVTSREPTGRETVEIVNEALIGSWERLRVWMAADRNFRVWQEQLRVVLHQWEGSGHDERALLQGPALAEAEKWLRERDRFLSPAEAAFIKASLAHQEYKRMEREREQVARERQRQWIVLSLAVGMAIVLALAVLAGFQWRSARQARNQALAAQATALAERNRIQVAFSRQIAAQALANLENHLDLALLLSVKAFQVAQTADARNSLDTAIHFNPRLTTYLRGHAGPVRSLALSPDGYILASGGDDKTILLWDLLSRRPFGAPLTGHTSAVVSLAFSPDGRLLASGSNSRTILLWDLITGKLAVPPLEGHTSSVRSLAFSPDGTLLASASDDNTIRLWQVSTGKPAGDPLVGHTAGVRSIAFSPDGTTLASGGDDNRVLLWDVATRTPKLPALSGHQGWVRSVAFSPNGKILASGSSDWTIILWDLESNQPRRPALFGHTADVLSLAFNPGGDLLASGGADGTIILWNVATGQPYRPVRPGQSAETPAGNPAPEEERLGTTPFLPANPLRDITTGRPLDSLLTGHLSVVDSLVFHRNGHTLISGSADGTIILWDIAPDPAPSLQIEHLAGQRDGISGIAFSPDGKTLVSSSRDHTIYLWDTARRRLIAPPLEGHTSDVLCVAFSPNGQILASCGQEGVLRLWDIATHRPIGQPLTGHASAVRSAAFSPDGKVIASGGDDGKIILWDSSSVKALTTLDGHTSAIFSVTFSPKEYILASGSDDHTVRLWDAVTGQLLFPPLTGHTDRVRSVAFSPDGKLLASASDDGSLRLWDVSTGKPVGAPMVGHTSYVMSVAFSPDGKLLASGSADGTIRLWDAATGQGVSAPLTGHSGPVRSVAFSPDNRLLASGGEDRTLRLWDIGMSAYQAYACHRANRNLTPAEWTYFFGNEPYDIICPDIDR